MTGLLVFKVTQQNQQGESLVQPSGCPVYALVLTLELGSSRLLPLAWMQQHVNTYICQRHSFKSSSPGWSRERGLQATIIRILDTKKKVAARHKSYCFKVVQADAVLLLSLNLIFIGSIQSWVSGSQHHSRTGLAEEQQHPSVVAYIHDCRVAGVKGLWHPGLKNSSIVVDPTKLTLRCASYY